MTVLEVQGLACATVSDPPVQILHDVSLSVSPGEVVGLIGESGSGKTMAALAVLGLLPNGVGATDGVVTVDGTTYAPEVTRRAGLAAIFQNPRAALNPTMRIGRQIARVLHAHTDLSGADAEQECVSLLRRCGVPGADNVIRSYPHELSGGMCQRVMIAMAIAARPKILIADEPTTALDLTIQAQIIDLLRDVMAETNCGVLLITHDLGVVAEMCDRVVVLLGGHMMEHGSVIELFDDPLHPYTRFLLDPAAFPSTEALIAATPAGCPFVERCPEAIPACTNPQPLRPVRGRHVACRLYDEVES